MQISEERGNRGTCAPLAVSPSLTAWIDIRIQERSRDLGTSALRVGRGETDSEVRLEKTGTQHRMWLEKWVGGIPREHQQQQLRARSTRPATENRTIQEGLRLGWALALRVSTPIQECLSKMVAGPVSTVEPWSQQPAHVLTFRSSRGVVGDDDDDG